MTLKPPAAAARKKTAATEELEPPSGRAAHGGVTSPTKPAWRPNASSAPVPEPPIPDPATTKKTTTKKLIGGGDVTPRDDGAVEAPSGTRLTPSKNQTVTILVVRLQKPPRATSAAAAAEAEGEEGQQPRRPPPPPVPVPFTFKRRVDEPNGELALAELMPVIQVGLALPPTSLLCVKTRFN
jgi:hypothetical protein